MREFITLSKIVAKFATDEKWRYLLVGGWNTFFGYAVGVGLYKALSIYISTWVVAILANILAISMSFFTYKILVFQTPGRWLAEYIKCYISYSGMAVVGVTVFTTLIEVLNMNIWIAQGLTIAMTAIASYFVHKNFTFK